MGTTVIPAEWKSSPEFKAITAIRTLSMDAVQHQFALDALPEIITRASSAR